MILKKTPFVTYLYLSLKIKSQRVAGRKRSGARRKRIHPLFLSLNIVFRLMDQGLLGDIVKTQDLPHIVVFVAKNPSGYHLAWKFLKENWNKLAQK